MRAWRNRSPIEYFFDAESVEGRKEKPIGILKRYVSVHYRARKNFWFDKPFGSELRAELLTVPSKVGRKLSAI